MTLNFDDLEPWKSIERVNLSDGGEILARFGDNDYRDDGSNGQVMVRIPKFYYRAEHDSRSHGYYISPYRLSGYRVSRMHWRNGKEVDEVFIGAYKASIYDVSDGAYLLNDEQVADFDADKLCSIAGAKPCSGDTQELTLPNARKLAQNRGPGWGLVDFISASMVQMLLLVELGHFDAQTKIGQGIVNKSLGTGNEAEITGQTAELGNQSGQATGNPHNSVSYRGLEDWWGNILEWTDGINIKDNVPYVADHDYVSDKFDGHYKPLGITLPSVGGFIADIAVSDDYDWGFLPSKTGATASTGLCDRFYHNPGDRVATRGGFWGSGLAAGPFYWSIYSAASHREHNRGARLLYVRGSD